ncbi:MAG: methionyl-tRNA formyltransferase [Deltaproteobacteria bacterium]|nr:methionyl-tRNA formyltransferase [Deltaproteobacteria bacterium]
MKNNNKLTDKKRECKAKLLRGKSVEKIKIGYFADGPWAHEAFLCINADPSFEIEFICARFDKPDQKLKQFADENSIAFYVHSNINSDEFRNIILHYDCDIFVSMSFNQIFKAPIINLPPMKTINCHAGALPFYRGRNILNWALINDEKFFGITAHYIDEGIDTGNIILQRYCEINDDDNYATLLDKAYTKCAEVLYDGLKILQGYEIEPIKQSTIHPIGFYCGQRKEGDEIIDWNQTSREVFNFIRAICKPGPMARSFVGQSEIRINKAQFVENAPCYKGMHGHVIGKYKGGFIVKTKDSFIKLVEYECPQKIKVGDRLQTNDDGYRNI